jgi:hypothetical protein
MRSIILYLFLLVLPTQVILTSCGKKENTEISVPKPQPEPEPEPEPSDSWKGVDVVKLLQDKTNLIKTITSQSRVMLEDGIEHTAIKFGTSTDKNMSIHVVIANLASTKVTAQVLNPYNTDEKRFQVLSEMAKDNEEIGTKLSIAINGDYFSWSNMETTGPFIYDGKVRKANPANSTRPAFGITRASKPVFLNAPSGFSNIYQFGDNLLRHLVGGNVWYIYNGNKMSFTDTTVEPRSSLGMLDKDQVVFIAVDGRNAVHSSGMSYAQMQSMYEALDAKFAFNLDGGGSTTVVVRNQDGTGWNVVNQPSDNPPRAIANGVAFVYK